MSPIKSLGNSRAKYNYKFGLTGFEAALPPPETVYSDDVFNTWVESYNLGNKDIQNNIDLTKGGLVWLKRRNGLDDHLLCDTVNGENKVLKSNSPNPLANNAYAVTGFNSNGFSTDNGYAGDQPFTHWTFRKQPGFFTIKTWVGDGQGDRYLDHDLESVPGFVIVKNLTDSQDWGCYHKSLGAGIRDGLTLNQTYESGNTNIINPLRTTPTASQIYIRGGVGEYNTLDKSYVAYIFAHDDQRFGTDKDESIIKCGDFTAHASGVSVDIGWEPQFVMWKSANVSGNWHIQDMMRGMSYGPDSGERLFPNTSDDEDGTFVIGTNPTGFDVKPSFYADNTSIVYIAIRRPHKPITDPTKLFTVGGNTSSEPEYVSNFVVDMAFHRNLGTNVADDTVIFSRLTGSKALITNSTAIESTPSALNQFDFMDGWGDNQANNSNYKSWMFRRAPGFFDVVAYDATGNVQTVPHNLGVTPEMIIVKDRDLTYDWGVYHTGLTDPLDEAIFLNSDAHEFTSTIFNKQAPTSTNFYVNYTSGNYVAYLFASLPGVSKVGTFQGNSSTKDIDCGFSNGARFVMIKRNAGGGTSGNHWTIWDKTRGIVAGDDPYFLLNDDAAEVTDTDYIDHLDAGFRLTSTAPSHVNGLGNNFIFLAIA